jgi:hypothetical protein
MRTLLLFFFTLAQASLPFHLRAGNAQESFSSRFHSDEITAPAQDSLNVRCLGRTLFEPFDIVECDGGDCFIGSRNDLVMYDVTDLHNIRIKDYVSFPGHQALTDLSRDGSYLYIARNEKTFWIVERNSSEDIEIVGSYTAEQQIEHLFAKDGIAYVQSWYTLLILDVSDPGNVQELGSYLFQDYPVDIVVVDTICYVADNIKGLRILDVSNPREPVEIGLYETGRGVYAVSVRDSLAYISGDDDRFSALSVVNPSEPVLLDSIAIGDWYGDQIQLCDHYALLRAGHELLIMDIEDPGDIQIVGTLGDRYEGYFDLSQTFLYILEEDPPTDIKGMRIYDISNPREPVEAGYYLGDHFIEAVEVDGDMAYVCDEFNGKLYLVDVSDKNFPRIVNSVDIPGASDVAIEYPLAYVGSMHGSPQEGFHILDVSDPHDVHEIGFVDIRAEGVFVKYPYAYLVRPSYDNTGLYILDISSPDSMVELGYNEILYPLKVVVKQEVAYVAAALGGTYIIDVSEPRNPFELANLPTYDFVWDLDIFGDYLYVASGWSGLWVVDVSNPSDPELIDWFAGDDVGSVFTVSASEPYVYITAGGNIWICDVSVPEQIEPVGFYTDLQSNGICGEYPYIYLGSSHYGFYIFEFSPPGVVQDPGPEAIPKGFSLSQNYPNPFNPMTTIDFKIPESAGGKRHVKLVVYDVRGRLIKMLIDSEMESGSHKAVWDGKDEKGTKSASGVYFFRMQVGSFTSTKKMTLLQ